MDHIAPWRLCAYDGGAWRLLHRTLQLRTGNWHSTLRCNLAAEPACVEVK